MATWYVDFHLAVSVVRSLQSIKLEVHDADTDTDILARILEDVHVGVSGEDVCVGVGVVECQLNAAYLCRVDD